MCSKILPKDLAKHKSFFCWPIIICIRSTQTNKNTMGHGLHMYEYTLDFDRPATRRRLLRPLSRVI